MSIGISRPLVERRLASTWPEAGPGGSPDELLLHAWEALLHAVQHEILEASKGNAYRL